MRAVVQRVSSVSLAIEGDKSCEIAEGLLVFVGIGREDGDEDITWLARKLPQIRLFPDENGQMNRSLMDTGADLLLVSQFTLFGNLRKGTRLSYNRAAPPEIAVPIYEKFITQLEAAMGRTVSTGTFGAHMDIRAVNDGPVTLILDSREKRF